MISKIITASVFTLAITTGAMAQTDNTGGGADNSWTKGPGTPSVNQPANPSAAPPPMATDSMTTQGINDGTSGSSGADTNENCPPGTPGAGTSSTSPDNAKKINPACN